MRVFIALLLTLFASFNLQALDLKGAITDAVKQKIEQQKTESTQTEEKKTQEKKSEPENAGATDTNNAATDASKGRTLPEFNWKNPSKKEEVALGREITGNLLGAAPLVKDAALQKYVNQVGRWVASQSDRANLPWRFGVIESNDINAFAAPGGYVLITKGLYQQLQNEAQLAGVLAHEIGHIVKKHQLRVIQKQQLLNIGAQLLGSRVGENNQLVTNVIGSGAEISARGLDKSAEYEADRLGITYATRAGYEPLGLAEVLQMLEQNHPQDDSLALLYKTHPLPEARLNALNDAIGSQLDKVGNGKNLAQRFYKLK